MYHTYTIMKNKQKRKNMKKISKAQKSFEKENIGQCAESQVYIEPPIFHKEIEMNIQQSYTQSVWDPFININREDKENLNLYKYGKLWDDDIVFKDDSDGDDDTESKEKAKKMEIQLIYHITEENWYDMGLVKTKSGGNFGRKHEKISAFYSNSEINYDIIFWMSDFMIKILMQNTMNSQIYLVDFQIKIPQDQYSDDEINIISLLLFDKISSNFMPVLYAVSNGPLIYETFDAVLNFMKDEFPNFFKPVKFVVDNHKCILDLIEPNQIHFNLYNHIKIIWQQMLDSFIWTIDELINEDIQLFVLFWKASILWWEDKDFNKIATIFESSSIDQSNLRRFLHNLKTQFSYSYLSLNQVHFLDEKCFELFKEIEIAKEWINSLFMNFLPLNKTHRLHEWLEAVQLLENEYQWIYDNALDPNEELDRFSPIWDMHLSMIQIKDTILKWITDKLSMKEIKENLRFGTMLEENPTVVIYSELFETIEMLKSLNLTPTKISIIEDKELNDIDNIDDIVDMEAEDGYDRYDLRNDQIFRQYNPKFSEERNSAFFTVFK